MQKFWLNKNGIKFLSVNIHEKLQILENAAIHCGHFLHQWWFVAKPSQKEEINQGMRLWNNKGVYCAAYSTHAAVVFWRSGCNSTFHLHAGPMTNRAIKLFERAEWRFYVCKHEDRRTHAAQKKIHGMKNASALPVAACACSSVTNLLLARTLRAAVEDAASGALASHNFYYLRT